MAVFDDYINISRYFYAGKTGLPLPGLLKNVRLLRRCAPPNDKERIFSVIASDSENRAAISCVTVGFSTNLSAGMTFWNYLQS